MMDEQGSLGVVFVRQLIIGFGILHIASAPKTIRDYLKKRCQLAFLFPATFMVGASAGIAHLPWLIAIVVFLLLLSLSFSLVFLALRMTKCPRCRARLRGAARAGGREKPTVDNCPSCGVSFDELMPIKSPG
jgi:hypothetical protein